jgi:hypothetical protein
MDNLQAQSKIIKFKPPVLVEERFYGRAANTRNCVRFRIKKEEIVQDATKVENSTVGKIKRSHGI